MVRLLYGKQIMDDDRQLGEYSVPDGTVISVLFEPDVDINVKVASGPQSYQLVVPNSTIVMALKVHVFEVAKCGVAPDKMQIMFGDIPLENALPLHYFGITNGSKLTVLKPYITVSIEDNHGDVLCKRLSKKDTIAEVKVKLSSTIRSPSPQPMEEPSEGPPPPGHPGHPFGRRGHHHLHGAGMRMRQLLKRTKPPAVAMHPSVDDMRLFVVRKNNQVLNYDELCDEMTVTDHKLKDNDQLYLLSYKWTNQTSVIVTTKAGTKLLGVEPDDTFRSIKVRTQDQLGVPFSQVVLQHNAQPPSENVKISSVVKQYPFNIHVV